MPKKKLVYTVSEARSNIDEIQRVSESGLIPKIINENTNAVSYMINQKIIDSLLERIKMKSVVEFDEELKKYTAFNKLVPQIYGEGNTKEEAIKLMLLEAKSFAKDYAENIELFSNILDGTQQFFLNNLLFNIEDDNKISEILKIS
jgi:hypothetical protein